MSSERTDTIEPMNNPDMLPRSDPPALEHRGVSSVTLADALRRYPLVALLPVIVLAVAGAAIGLRRAPTYTASTQIQVGAPDITAQSTPGYVQAEVTLASAYSREVSSQFVYAPIAHRLGISQVAVSSRLSSSAVPSSPAFSINATGPSAAAAIRLSQLATAALTHAINVIDQGETASTQLLGQYRTAQQAANQLAAKSARLQARAASLTPATTVSTAGSATSGSTSGAGTQVSSQSSPASRAAQLEAQVAQLRATALAQQYTAAATNSRGATIQVLNPASSATSDRRTLAQRFGLIGATAGIILGAALAFLVARTRRRGPLDA